MDDVVVIADDVVAFDLLLYEGVIDEVIPYVVVNDDDYIDEDLVFVVLVLFYVVLVIFFLANMICDFPEYYVAHVHDYDFDVLHVHELIHVHEIENVNIDDDW